MISTSYKSDLTVVACIGALMGLCASHILHEQVIVDLDDVVAASPNRHVRYNQSAVSLTLVCRGSSVENKTWSSDGLLRGLSVWLTSDNSLALHLLCSESFQQPCQFPQTLWCSGRRSSGRLVEVSVTLQRDASDNAPLHLINSPAEKSITDMDYFGLIIGFSVCLALGLISALIVCVQKKCNLRKWAKIFGGSCLGYHTPLSHQEDGDGLRQGKLGSRQTANIPFIRFSRQMRFGSQHSNQKSSTMYEL